MAVAVAVAVAVVRLPRPRAQARVLVLALGVPTEVDRPAEHAARNTEPPRRESETAVGAIQRIPKGRRTISSFYAGTLFGEFFLFPLPH